MFVRIVAVLCMHHESGRGEVVGGGGRRWGGRRGEEVGGGEEGGCGVGIPGIM